MAEQNVSNIHILSVRHINSILILRNTGEHFSTTLGYHFKQQNYQEKGKNAKKKKVWQERNRKRCES